MSDLDADFLSFADDNDEEDEAAKDGGVESKHDSGSASSNLLPPWMDRPTDFRRVQPLVALHNEIIGISNLLSLTPKEMDDRGQLVERFKKLAQDTFGADKCEVVVFGSQATGLCLPSSDIDIAIHIAQDDDHPKEPGDDDAVEWNDMRNKSPLERIADSLRTQWVLSYLEVISNTRVPLCKFTSNNISVDVSLDVLIQGTAAQASSAAAQAATLVKTYLQAMPPLHHLTIFLKYFLKARALNEPYSGGVGSFMLQMMIVSFLQHREREFIKSGKGGQYNLGCLLIEFLEMFGDRFNYCTTGISVRHDGAFFAKGAKDNKKHFFMPSRHFSLAIENPLDLSSDVGKASFRIQTVQRAFSAAHKVLLAHVATPVVPTVSILATIIPPTDEMRQRRIDQQSTSQNEKREGRRSSKSPRRRKRPRVK